MIEYELETPYTASTGQDVLQSPHPVHFVLSSTKCDFSEELADICPTGAIAIKTPPLKWSLVFGR